MHLPKLYYLSAQAFLMENTKKKHANCRARPRSVWPRRPACSCVRDPQSGARALAAEPPLTHAKQPLRIHKPSTSLD